MALSGKHPWAHRLCRACILNKIYGINLEDLDISQSRITLGFNADSQDCQLPRLMKPNVGFFANFSKMGGLSSLNHAYSCKAKWTSATATKLSSRSLRSKKWTTLIFGGLMTASSVFENRWRTLCRLLNVAPLHFYNY